MSAESEHDPILSDRDRQAFLARLSFELTKVARAEAYESTPERAVRQLRAFNEMQHSISQSIGHELAGTADPSFPLLEILRDFATQADWDGLDDTIDRARLSR